jgi:biotin-dependent carboxylase-like uncharacterized protein
VTLTVIDPGVQATVQAGARTGFRHAGVPFSGPADAVSMALANRLVGQSPEAPSIEIAYGPAAFRFEVDVQIAVAGAPALVRIAGTEAAQHRTLKVRAGELVEIGAATAGARIYLSVNGRLECETFLGSSSTYLPAALGGHRGRALRKGDQLELSPLPDVSPLETSESLRLPVSRSFALRAVAGPDWVAGSAVSESPFHATARLSRMGIELEGSFPGFDGGASRPSSAVFPGALQVTPQGRGFLLLADGQTTGGYPHLLQVIRADRHLMGQIRPKDQIRFLMRSQELAETALRQKQALLQAWMPEFRL